MAEVIAQSRRGHITGIGPTIPKHIRERSASSSQSTASTSSTSTNAKIEAMEVRLRAHEEWQMKMCEYLRQYAPAALQNLPFPSFAPETAPPPPPPPPQQSAQEDDDEDDDDDDEEFRLD